ncbi:unnamed protein product, partial [Prorocentrum cordatum]
GSVAPARGGVESDTAVIVQAALPAAVEASGRVLLGARVPRSPARTPFQRATRLATGEVPAEARPTARPSSTLVASQPLASLDGSEAPPSPPPRDLEPCQQLRNEEAQSSGGAGSVAGEFQARLDFDRALQAQKDCVNARSKKAVMEKETNKDTNHNKYKKYEVLVKSAALGVVDAGSCIEDLQVEASEFGTSAIVEGGSRCDGMLFGIAESEAGGVSLQSERTREAETQSKVGGTPKAVVEESRLAQWRLERDVPGVIGKKTSKQCEFAPSEVADGGSCYKGKLDEDSEFGTSE